MSSMKPAASRKGARKPCRAIDNLASVYELVKAYGLGERVGVDLGITKDLDYYSGLLIEGYTPQLGFTLGSGGRYDSLVGRFGQEFAATGFAFGVESDARPRPARLAGARSTIGGGASYGA